MPRKYLMTPGPSPVPAQVREAMSREIMHHRTDEYKEILTRVHQNLKYIFATENPVLVFSASGTGALEAAVVNFLSPGDKIIVVNGGKFGERWSGIAKAYGVEVIEYTLEWGAAPDPLKIRKLLEENKNVKAVYTTLCETSTGTVYDIEKIAAVVKAFPAIMVVDGVSGLGQDELLTDAWGVDVVVSGSQKGFMLPPGLAFFSVSPKAEKLIETSTLPKYYFDLKKALKSYAKNDTPFTSAVALIVALDTALSLIKEEGLEKRQKKFRLMAKAARAGAEALGLAVFSQRPSDSVTAVLVPQSIKSTDLVKKLRTEEGLSIAGGQEAVKEKIIRIAHMGWINEQDLLMCFSLIEKVLKELGYDFPVGASLKKIQEVLYA